MKNKLILYSFFLTVMVNAQTKYRLNVEELFHLGMENSSRIKASKLETDIYKEKEGISKTSRLPKIDFSMIQGYTGKPSILDKDLSYIKQSDIPSWKQNYNLELSQPLYEGGKIKYSIKNASIETEISKLNLERDKAELKLILIKNYLELLRLYKQKEVFSKNIIEAEKRLHDIENLKKEGIVTHNDVLRNRIILSNYELSQRETENDISIISQELDIVLGLNESYIIIPDSLILESSVHLESEDYYTLQGYEKYPELKISSFNIEKAKINEKITKSKYLPSIHLNAGNNLLRPITGVSPAQDLYMNSWAVTLGVSYNISSWFDHKHTINEIKYQVGLQENIKEQTLQNIRMNVKSAYIKHREALERVEVLNKMIEQAKENYRVTYNKYFNQLAILTDLLDASSVLLDVELQLTVAKANSIYAYYLLLKASGNL